MAIVYGLFANREQAVAALEGLRAARFDTARVRLVGGPDDPGELATEAGGGATVAAGPSGAVLGGLLEGHVARDDLHELEERLAGGAVLLLSEDLDEQTGRQLADLMRERAAEHVTSI